MLNPEQRRNAEGRVGAPNDVGGRLVDGSTVRLNDRGHDHLPLNAQSAFIIRVVEYLCSEGL